MLTIELIFFKKFKNRIRLTKKFMSRGYKVENHHEKGYIIIEKFEEDLQ